LGRWLASKARAAAGCGTEVLFVLLLMKATGCVQALGLMMRLLQGQPKRPLLLLLLLLPVLWPASHLLS